MREPRFAGDLRHARAHWIARDLVVWRPSQLQLRWDLFLAWDEGGALASRLEEGVPLSSLPLRFDAAGLDRVALERFPHLATLPVFRLPTSTLERTAAALRSQVCICVCDEEGKVVEATALQVPGVLDAVYGYRGPLGATFDAQAVPTLRLWAPTARRVRLLLFDSPSAGEGFALPMERESASGVWSIAGEPGPDGWYGKYYLYEVEVFVRATGRFEVNRVTDPYSVSLSCNSRRSQVIDLRDPLLLPPAWGELRKPPLARFADIVLYELHLRDFSASDPEVPESLRGTYKAFTVPGSLGMRHLRGLADAGVSHLHLLPLADIATIEEDRALFRAPQGDLAALPPESEEQQERIAALGPADPFNWGYDPLHFLVPEGSYASDADGPARIRECREMVAALAAVGLRVVLDVAFNHTFAAGQDELSVLDRIVPGYYHRLNGEGEIETSTVCANTASEHAMMERLMVDAVVTWARDYKFDGFRFDLMGHHMKRNLLAVRAALDALTLENDGIDGRAIYLYGEGWNFGEVANGARGEQAIQANLAGTGIGTFNDRLRDAVRGGGAFEGLREQGFADGLYLAPNGMARGSAQEARARLLSATDTLRASLAGALADFRFIDRFGAEIAASQLEWNGQTAGYTGLPWESVNYVESHDNETLFDAIQLKAPTEATPADRVRMHNLAVSLVALSQGVPFFHAGVELLRSKSGDRNSYHSGDWFNRLDFSRQRHNWGSGLPPARDNRDRWPTLAPLLADRTLMPGPAEIESAYRHFLEMLSIRRSTPLFRLPSAGDVRKRLSFFNTGPDQLLGVLGFSIADSEGAIDLNYERVVVLFNASDETQILDVPVLAGCDLTLHPVQRRSYDRVARASSFHRASGAFSIPGRTTAVFWSPRCPPLLLAVKDATLRNL